MFFQTAQREAMVPRSSRIDCYRINRRWHLAAALPSHTVQISHSGCGVLYLINGSGSYIAIMLTKLKSAGWDAIGATPSCGVPRVSQGVTVPAGKRAKTSYVSLVKCPFVRSPLTINHAEPTPVQGMPGSHMASLSTLPLRYCSHAASLGFALGSPESRIGMIWPVWPEQGEHHKRGVAANRARWRASAAAIPARPPQGAVVRMAVTVAASSGGSPHSSDPAPFHIRRARSRSAWRVAGWRSTTCSRSAAAVASP